MPNWMILKVNHLWRIGLIGIPLWAAPIVLWSQEMPPTEQVQSKIEQPFSSVDDSLSKAADAVLASAAQTTVSAKGPVESGEIASASPGISFEPRSRPWNSEASLAPTRVELLRPVVEPILRSHGVPSELLAVMLVESGGRAFALSPKGARGPWQLMPDTARRYGLRVDQIWDDRIDLFRATDAAAKYLHDLYGQFGDWKLALAAYNTGEINVQSAIQRAGSQDFDQLANLRILPLETRNYVPRVLATVQSIGRYSNLGESRSSANRTTVFAVSSR
jgi:Transglycosylase SLT domain